MLSSSNIKEISNLILSKPYWVLQELRNEIDVSDDQFKDSLNTIFERYDELGINVEVIELNSIDYLVPYVKSDQLSLTGKQLGLLIVFGYKTKLTGGYLPFEEESDILENYFEEMDCFQKKNFIEKKDKLGWSLTPVGVLMILPYLEEFKDLIGKLLKT